MTSHRLVTLALLMLVAFVPGLVLASRHEKARVVTAHQTALAAPFDTAAYQSYVATLPRDGSYYVVEGDMLMTEQQVRAYLAGRSLAPRPPGPELTVNVVNGDVDYWTDPSRRTLTYAVDRPSFPDERTYRLVVGHMTTAAAEWTNACADCGVRFVHLIASDVAPTHNDVLFIVRHHDAGGAYIAAAFFPSYATSRRYLNVDPSYFTTSFDPVGVFRHELGHVLGYRHEHIRDVPGCYREDNQWKPLTGYDARSVMHYFCGGAGSMLLTLTDVDRAGHRSLYSRKK